MSQKLPITTTGNMETSPVNRGICSPSGLVILGLSDPVLATKLLKLFPFKLSQMTHMDVSVQQYPQKYPIKITVNQSLALESLRPLRPLESTFVLDSNNIFGMNEKHLFKFIDLCSQALSVV